MNRAPSGIPPCRWGAALVVAVAMVAGGAGRADEAPAADRRLAEAYRRCHFSRQYPLEMVKEIQDKLQNAPRAVDALAPLAKDSRREVRLLVVLLLAELGEPDGAKLLWSLLQDDVEAVRVAASGALVRLGRLVAVPTDLAAVKDQRPEIRRLAVATLGRLSLKNIEPTLIGCLEDENEQVRVEAVKALAERSNEAVGRALLKRLQDPSAQVRTVAARCLSPYTTSEVVKALEDALKDPDWHVRAGAITSLGRRSSTAVSQAKIAEAIMSVLHSDDFALVRDRAADALAFARSDQTSEALVQVLVSDDRSARRHAAKAICTGRCVAALPQLMKHCKHTNVEVRQLIMEIFGAIGGPDQLPAISEATGDESPIVRLSAVDALQKIGARTGSATLLQKIADPDPHVRAAVTRALGRLGDKTVVSRVLPLLHDANGFVRSAAAEALGRLGDKSAVPALVSLLGGVEVSGIDTNMFFQDPNSPLAARLKFTEIEQKSAVLIALGELRATEAVDPLIQHGLKSENLNIKATAAYSLGQIGDRRAVTPLEDTVRAYYNTIAQMDTTGFVIDDGSAPVADNRKRDREKEARVRAAVVWALGQIGDPAAQAMLTRALNDNNSLVRDNAVEAVAKLQERQEREQRALNVKPASVPDKSRSASAARTP